MERICGIWVNRDKDTGKVTSLKGKWLGIGIVLIPNKEKLEAKHPDYILYLSKDEQEAKKEQDGELKITMQDI